MGKKDYLAAIEAYSKALELVPANPIYLSNRAAAYSASRQHVKASIDAELAVSVDPAYTKAWSRLGLALYALGDAKGSLKAYEKGIEHEGNGGSDAMKRGYETAKKKVDEEDSSISDDDVMQPSGPDTGGMPDLAGLASMLGGAGGGRGGGGGAGGPDLASMMNNPMFANMAQKMMSNPSLMSNLMNNPQLRQMAENYGVGGGAGGAGGSGSGSGRGGGGGGMPDLGSLMSDPAIAEL